MKRLLFVLIAIFGLGVSGAAACTAMPAAYPPKLTEGGPAWRTQRIAEAYSQHRLVERPFATIVIGDSLAKWWPHELLEGLWGGPVLNAARGGATTLDWRQWLAEWDWSAQAPAVVHISLGRNDISRGVCPAPIAASVLAVIADVKAKWPAARVVWQSIPPSGDRLRVYAFEIREVNRLVTAQAATGGFEVLDAWTPIFNWCRGRAQCGAFVPDLVHLGLNAYEALYAIQGFRLP